MKRKYKTSYRGLAGNSKPEPEPRTEFSTLEIPDNSEVMRRLKESHPRIVAFERKYQGVNWRERFGS